MRLPIQRNADATVPMKLPSLMLVRQSSGHARWHGGCIEAAPCAVV